MKKLITIFLVFLLISNIMLPSINAMADSNVVEYDYNQEYLTELEEEILEEFEEELVQEFGYEVLEDIDVDISISEEEFIVEIEFEEEDLEAI